MMMMVVVRRDELRRQLLMLVRIERLRHEHQTAVARRERIAGEGDGAALLQYGATTHPTQRESIRTSRAGRRARGCLRLRPSRPLPPPR